MKIFVRQASGSGSASIDPSRFCWDAFRAYFPYGDLSLREGEYARLVKGVLESLADAQERECLLDLLDTQWATFVKQVWIANELGSGEDMSAEPALARIQIDQNLRAEFGLQSRRVRDAILHLKFPDSLLSRIVR